MNKQEIEIAGCLRRLFRHRYVIRTKNEKWFRLMVENRQALEQVVSAFAATVEINDALGVAYVRPIDDETEEKLAMKLSKTQTLSAFASALLIHLRWQRMRFYLEPNGNDVPIIAATELREFIEPFSKAKIDLQFERQFRRSLEELTDLQALIETQADAAYFEITALCDLLLPADKIQELRQRAEVYFTKLNGDPGNAR